MKNITFPELLAFADRNPDGFTIDKYGKVITKGVAIAVTNGQNDFNKMTPIEVYLAVRQSDELVFGGWRDKDGKYYIDAVHIAPYMNAHAIRFAQMHSQKAVFNITTSETIETN
tara:strand:- start:106 stop:447 length:342 start_codon:yes stop_codon:yes gene_type:complete